MDTNLIVTNIAQVAQTVADASSSTASALNWNTIIMAIIGGVTTIVSGIIALLLAKVNSNSKIAAHNSEATKVATLASADNLVKIHEAVNSERTAMLAEVKKLHGEIKVLAEQKAVLEEQQAVRVQALLTGLAVAKHADAPDAPDAPHSLNAAQVGEIMQIINPKIKPI